MKGESRDLNAGLNMSDAVKRWSIASAIVLSVGAFPAGRSVWALDVLALEVTDQLRQPPVGIKASDRIQANAQAAEAQILSEAAFSQIIPSRRSVQLQEATLAWRAVAQSYRLAQDLAGQQRAYWALSDLYRAQNLPIEREAALRQALGFARARQDFPALIQTYNDVGLVLLDRGHPREAEKSFLEALRIADSIDHLPGLGRSLANLGVVANVLGNPRAALDSLKKAIGFYQQAKDAEGEAIATLYLGDIYQNLRLLQEATGAYRTSLQYGREKEDVGIQSRAITGLALAEERLGRASESLRLLDERLTRAMTGTNAQEQIAAYRAMAEFHQRQGDLEAADRNYSNAVTIARRSGNRTAARQLSQTLENVRRAYHLRSPQR